MPKPKTQNPKRKTQKRRTQKRRTRRGGTGKGQSTRYNIIVPEGEGITTSQLDRKYPITGPSTVASDEGVSKSSPKLESSRKFRFRNPFAANATPVVPK